ncbi:hypothetical protein GOP47_0021100 [Adiantum capillus-veneris]|uniref:AB hydrolase-1 domain-containing protein n=1 Tax=Adiantum capillus-veneris TaxID=13818 RepID=A0A9D4UAP5_ADICA|nr:hypothetical protein GOP47_0021100 [Adiantum capillus-veneris]
MVFLKDGKTLEEAMNVKVVGDDDAEETIVLAHGFGGTQDQWTHVVNSLANHMSSACRVVLLDWPGACATDPDDFDEAVPSIFDPKSSSLYDDFANLLNALLQELHIESCSFVGHSMSAMIGCIAALDCPHLFKKLILIGASPRYLNDRDYYGGFEQEDLEHMFGAMEADFEGWAANFAAAVVGMEADQDAIDAFSQTLSSMRPEVAVAMAKAIFESDYRGTVEELMLKQRGECMPEVHVLQTCKDLAVPLLVSDYLKQQYVGGSNSNGYLEILQTEGHIPQLSDPKLFCAALLRHLE